MKKIVFKVEEKTININGINNESFVGVLWKDGDKAMVIRLEENVFTWLHNTSPSVSHIASKRTTKQELVREVEKKDNFFEEAFVFKTYKDLLTWFSK